ncbi:PREDICTED: C-C chemokine receptor type 1 [Chinchilla lanigera]|uniref:C-C chemokine receptor type 1 n=1 Tax=Chinchilla lanigera TaxID=34839 RepID=A0A8C2W6B9_CHILA|nr:PREDICTED: C-C chemokine receptor type 1 [Chinchilla lanigera]
MESPAPTEDYGLTTEYDYGDSTPCHKEAVRVFGSQLLPPLYSLVFIIGVVGNILVVLVLMKYKRLRSMTSIYLLNLALSDLLFLFTLPFWIDYKVRDTWIFGDGMCKLLSGLYHVGLYSEIFFIILLTIDRYLAIVHSVFALQARTITFGIVTSVITWALAILASVPGLYFAKTQRVFTQYTCSLYYPHESHQAWRYFQALKMNLLGLILPLLVMVFCYTGIIKVLLQRPNKEKAKAVRLSFIIMIIFFLFWTPYNLAVFVSAFQLHMFTNYCEQNKQLDMAMQVTEVIAYTHCCVNPIIYVFVGKRFRKYLYELFQTQAAVRLDKCQHFLNRGRLERSSSVSLSTGEQVLSGVL